MRKSTVFLPMVYDIVVRNDSRSEHPTHHVREDVALSVRHVDSARKVLSVRWKDGGSCDWYEVDGRLYRPFLGVEGNPIQSIDALAEELPKRSGSRTYQDYPLRTCFVGPMHGWVSPHRQPTREEVQPKRAERVLLDRREEAFAQALERSESLLLVGDCLMTASSEPIWCVGSSEKPWASGRVALRIQDHPDWEAPLARFALGGDDDAEALARRVASRFPDEGFERLVQDEIEYETFGGWQPSPVPILDPVDAWAQVRKMFGSVRMSEMPFDVLALIVRGEQAGREWRVSGNPDSHAGSMDALREMGEHPLFDRYETTFYTKQIREVVRGFVAVDDFASEYSAEDVDALSMGVR